MIRASSNSGPEDDSSSASGIDSSIGGATIPTLNPEEEKVAAEDVEAGGPFTESVPPAYKTGRAKSNIPIIPTIHPT
jgi:hypothetical protein